MDAYRKFARNVREFEITETHLMLLRNANVDWNECEFGAPSIDTKRPYGNSDVPRDIAEMLSPEIQDWEYDRADAYVDSRREELTRLHIETGVALEICLNLREVKAGRYRTVAWNRWERIGQAEAANGGEGR